MALQNKRVFDTDSALHATFNRYWGKWQIITYIFFVFSYAIVVGWMSHLTEYTLLVPKNVTCNISDETYNRGVNLSIIGNRTIIQRISGKSHYYENITYVEWNKKTKQNETKFRTKDIPGPCDVKEYGETVATQFEILCDDISSYIKVTMFSHYFGFFLGSLLLGFASDKGGRKSIILACIWSAGIMSTFQLVGHDYVSFVFFQFFLGLFVGVSFILNLNFYLEMTSIIY